MANKKKLNAIYEYQRKRVGKYFPKNKTQLTVATSICDIKK